MVETKTFVNAIVYLCSKPQEPASLEDLIHYERPQPVIEPEEVEEVEEVEVDEIEEALYQLSVGGGEDEDTVSDVSTITESSATEEIATAVNGASLPHVASSSEGPPTSQGMLSDLHWQVDCTDTLR